ncbi:MAG TPA: hypothetical protein PLZ51_01240 [Aggregatilineales bacterium]|nr:hypothetical protein [Aggregatilineales bacterium]
MKRLFLAVILTLTFVVSACSSTANVGGDDSPQNAIIGFLDASFKGDQDRILSLTCLSQQELVRLRFPTTAGSFVQAAELSVNFDDVELTITEQTATQAYITIAGSLQISGGGQSAQPIALTDILPFPYMTTVLEEGKWRICNSADISLRGIIESGANDQVEIADGLLCEALRGSVAENPFYQLGKTLGANADFTQLGYRVTEWNPNNGFIKITNGVTNDQLTVVNATRESGAWRICSTPETTVRMMLELALTDDFDTASQLVCPDQRATVLAELQTLRQRIVGLVNLENNTANPPFYEAVAILIFESAGVEQRNLRVQVAQVQYALSDETDTSATLAFTGNVRVQSIGLLQNIPVAQVMPESAQMIRQSGMWQYCPQPVTESTDA